jgi:cellulose synthase/poly-beta-1,6-N-acetylglucosamine synthase-like glycosyltransferase
MDGDMLTEDIDSALRACGKGLTAVHELNCVSYELAPTTWPSFWKQRLRWAQGWAQATLKHSILTFNKAQEGKRVFSTRFGLLNLLIIRELSYYLVTQFACLVFAFIVLNFPLSPGAFWRTVFFQYPVSEWMFFFRYVTATLFPSFIAIDSNAVFQSFLFGLHAVDHQRNEIRICIEMDDCSFRYPISILSFVAGYDRGLRACETDSQVFVLESHGKIVEFMSCP